MSNFILTLELKTNKYEESIINKRLEIGRKIYNNCLSYCFKKYKLMTDSKAYRKLIKQPKSKDRTIYLKQLNEVYGLTEYQLHDRVKPLQKYYKKHIGSHIAQKIATRCWSAFEKYIYKESKHVYLKRYGTFNSLENKKNNSNMTFDKEELFLSWNKLELKALTHIKDKYAIESLRNKVKYTRVLRKTIRGKSKYYIQLILGGIPPKKYNHNISEGKVGIDIGTQTIAISSNKQVKLLELAPNIDKLQKKKTKLQRKLDRQRRSNNPDNFNDDGTIKRGKRLKWKKSKGYKNTQLKLSELQRKQAVIRKQSHCILANKIISLGNDVKVEKMSFKGLQARSQETTKNSKGRFNRKSRFGKSLANKAPSMFLDILEYKLKYKNGDYQEVNTNKIKASQYNHIEDEYIKKKLSQRWQMVGNDKLQRDMYSAFILMCVNNDLETINKKMMIDLYENFKKLHDVEIKRLNDLEKTISSMGIKKVS